MRRKLITILCVVLMFFTFAIPVNAQSNSDEAYDSYTYWLGFNEKILVSSKPMYMTDEIFSGDTSNTGTLNQPKDIAATTNGELYILDSGNGRIIVTDENLKYIKKIGAIVAGDEVLNYTGASGLYIDSCSNLYIADTENARVIVCDLNGNLKKEITLPDSPLIPEGFIFEPVKVAVNSKGYIYVLSQGSYYGALVYAPDGVFEGFFGANVVSTDIADVFSMIWDNFFSTDSQRANSAQKMPYQFSDITIGPSDFVYTATGVISQYRTQSGQIRALSSTGKNILKIKENVTVDSAEGFDFSDVGVSKVNSVMRIQDFRELQVTDEGFIVALDSTYGKIFVYDGNCNLLNVFGGGVGEGIQKGTFQKATAIEVYEDNLYVVDMAKGSVTRFKETDFGTLLYKADALYMNGDFAAAGELFEQVITLDSNCQVAYRGIAKAEVISGNYKRALEYSRAGYDRITYSQAFQYVRTDLLMSNLGLIIGVIIVLILIFSTVYVYLRKKNKKLITNRKVLVLCRAAMHPFDSFNEIKYKNGGSLLAATILLVAFYVVSVSKDLYSGFIFSDFDSKSYNALFTLIGSVGLIVLWTLCNWGVTALCEGKSKLKETYIVACYAMIPQILFGIINIILSNILVLSESTLMTIISVISFIISALILCVGTMIVNEFNFFKFILTTIVTVLFMAVVVFMIFLVIILLQQLYGFGITLFTEIWYR